MENTFEQFEIAKRTALEIEDCYNGKIYKCPGCGQFIDCDGEEKIKCHCCGESFDVCDAEQLYLYDYFDDALDIEYRIGADRQYRSVQVCIAWGGPNIYIDTDTKCVEVYWGNHASFQLNIDVIIEIDSIFEEIYNSGNI